MAGDDSVRMEPTWLLEPVPLPDRRKGPGFLLLTGGRDSAPTGVPVEVVNLARSAPEIAASYSLFRRYVFDWRAPLTVPLTILIDSEGRANKIYPGVPSLSDHAEGPGRPGPAGASRTRAAVPRLVFTRAPPATTTNSGPRSLARDIRSRLYRTWKRRSASGRRIFMRGWRLARFTWNPAVCPKRAGTSRRRSN